MIQCFEELDRKWTEQPDTYLFSPLKKNEAGASSEATWQHFISIVRAS